VTEIDATVTDITVTAMTATVPDIAARIWARDASLWLPAEADAAAVDAVAGRLGWLDCIDWMLANKRAAELQDWAGGVITGGVFGRVIVIGMGGSSLAARVFAAFFEDARGLPLTVIDTTRPADIARLAGDDLRRALFIVASKSGDTVETADLHAFFRARLESQLGPASAADLDARFVFITDRDSALHRAAGGSRVFVNPADIGGRFSALSYFGLVPAALAGADAGRVLKLAQEFAAATRFDDPRENKALALGLRLGRRARTGRDKLILRLPRAWRAFGLWVEQLIAESCGKDGRGIVPVLAEDGDGVDDADPGGGDCMRARMLDLDDEHRDDDAAAAAVDNGLDIDLQLKMAGGYRLGAEFFRWQFATAVAAAMLKVNPFDQPDVAAAKAQTAAFIRAGQAAGIGRPAGGAKRGVTTPTYRIDAGRYDLLLAVQPGAAGGGEGVDRERADMALAMFAAGLEANSHLALLAYLPDERATWAALADLRRRVAECARVVCTAGIGPRYLHSTGQLHKGGPARAGFIQLLEHAPAADDDLDIPGRDYTFGELYRAQADGDFAALAAAGRPLLRVEVKPARAEALSDFVADFASAMDAFAPASPNRTPWDLEKSATGR